MNPPEHLHPYLKWLLYLSRVDAAMYAFYQSILEKRDQIFAAAARSNGQFKIRYQGKILDVRVAVWPDEAAGAYELVMVRAQGELVTAPSAASGAAGPPAP